MEIFYVLIFLYLYIQLKFEKMELTKKILLMILLVAGPSLIFAQSEEDVVPENLNSFSDESSALNFLSSQSGIVQDKNSAKGNSIYINQIGEENSIQTNITSNTTDVIFVQEGNWNTILLDVSGEIIKNKIIQTGDSNNLLNISNKFSGSQNFNVIQNGNNQDVTIYGSNSMSESLKINMTGDFKSVIVRNF